MFVIGTVLAVGNAGGTAFVNVVKHLSGSESIPFISLVIKVISVSN